LRIALVKPPITVEYANIIAPDLGLGMLAQLLRDRGHEVAILYPDSDAMPRGDFSEHLAAFGPDLVGIKVFTSDIRSALSVARASRNVARSAPIVVGGPHPTAVPAGTLEQIALFDFAFAGEAEIGFPRFVEHLDDGGDDGGLAGIPGLVWRGTSGEIRENPRAFVEDLDDLPDPARDHFDALRGHLLDYFPPHAWQGSYVPVQTTRGCPFRCNFCSVHAINGDRMRHRSIERVVQEIASLRERFGVHDISFIDDHLLWNKRRFIDLCAALTERFGDLRWETISNAIRASSLDPDVIEAMERSNCCAVTVSPEAGTDRVLKLMNKRTTVSGFVEKCELLHSRSSIFLNSFAILGYPGETFAELWQTILLLCRMPVNTTSPFLFIPHPGTVAWEQYHGDIPWTLDHVHTPQNYRRGERYGRLVGTSIIATAFVLFYLWPRRGVRRSLPSLLRYMAGKLYRGGIRDRFRRLWRWLCRRPAPPHGEVA